MAENVTPHVEDVRGSGAYPRRPAHLDRGRLETAGLLAGRILFGGYFLYNGINHLRNRKALASHARSKGSRLPAITVPVTGLMLIASGLSVLAGRRPKRGASLLARFLPGGPLVPTRP